MAKVPLPPRPALQPLPCVLLTVAGEVRPNVVTLAWVGVACSEPPMVGVAIRPSRLSHEQVEKAGEFVINLPRADMAAAVDYCGTVSGRTADKLASAGLTTLPAGLVGAPLIAECPLNLECVVRQTLRLGSHSLFLAEVVRVHADEGLVGEGGRVSLEGVELLGFADISHTYCATGPSLGTYGFSKGRPPR